MSETWLDSTTKQRYALSTQWRASVEDYLARALRDEISQTDGTLEAIANKVSLFWAQKYYSRIFPLRFGWERDANGWIKSVDLNLHTPAPFRKRFLDKNLLPPLLPDPENESWLLADRLLVECALLNVLATNRGLSDTVRHALRLAALLYPFRDKLQSALRAVWNTINPFMEALIRKQDNPTVGDLIRKVRTRQLAGEQVQIVGVVVQRIKSYVFETAGLNEIRGASTLLDTCIDALADDKVGKEIGNEVILRAAGSTLLFIAPVTDAHQQWEHTLNKSIIERTKTAFPVSARLTCDANALFTDYGNTIATFYGLLTVARATARPAFYHTLPFEARCTLCQLRAAEVMAKEPGDDTDRRQPLCIVCHKKRTVGQEGRRKKIKLILDVFGKDNQDDIEQDFGIEHASKKEEIVARDLDGLLPAKGERRKLLGVVYSDGNNFGKVAEDLKSIAQGLQWSARVKYTTQAAVALALGISVQAALYDTQRGNWQPGTPVLKKLPFQILAIGGDDLSLFAWGPVAVHFTARFTALTDRELEGKEQDSLSFSSGILITDPNTPVAKTVEYADDVLLKWAKQAGRDSDASKGRIAMLYAPSAEAIPTDLVRYRRETFLIGSKSTQTRLATTLRPYSAVELLQLLKTTHQLLKRGDMGRLERMIAAFHSAPESTHAGLLFYAYQRGRLEGKGDSAPLSWLESVEKDIFQAVYTLTEQENTQRQAWRDFFESDITDKLPLPAYGSTKYLIRYPSSEGRNLFGLTEKLAQDARMPKTWFSPLRDLLEIAKLMS